MTQATTLGPSGYPVALFRDSSSFTLNESIGNITISATAIVWDQAVASVTFSNFTSSATSVVEVHGVVSQTITNFTPSATAVVEVHATATVSIGAVLGNATAVEEAHAALSTSIGLVTIAATAKVEVASVLSKSIGNITISATAGVEDHIAGSPSISNFTITATAKAEATAALSKSIGVISVVAAAIAEIHLNGNITFDNFTLVATATEKTLPSPELTLVVPRRVRSLKVDRATRSLRGPTQRIRRIDVRLQKLFSEAAPGEREAYSFDFTKDLSTDETISSSTWTIEVTSTDSDATIDSNPTVHLFGGPTQDDTGKITSQVIDNLTAGNQYKLSALVTTTEGEKKEAHSFVNCVAA